MPRCLEAYVGGYGLYERYDHGEWLLQFCQTEDMSKANTNEGCIYESLTWTDMEK